MIKAVLIDLDGTLLDTAPDLACAANRMRADLGLPPLEVALVATFIGKGIATLVRRAVPEESLFERALPLFERYYGEESGPGSKPYPGALEGVQRMRTMGLRLACVTNKAERFTKELLARTGFASMPWSAATTWRAEARSDGRGARLRAAAGGAARGDLHRRFGQRRGRGPGRGLRRVVRALWIERGPRAGDPRLRPQGRDARGSRREDYAAPSPSELGGVKDSSSRTTPAGCVRGTSGTLTP